MNALGKRIVVFTMVWVLLVMGLAQLYDNVTGKGMPAVAPTPEPAEAQATPDADVARLAELQSCVQTDPRNLQCLLDLGSLYYQAKQWPQAQSAYQAAVLIDPHDPAVLLKLAGTFIFQNNFKDAVPTLQQAAALKPDSPEIHLLLGLSLSKITPAQNTQAIAEWRKVVELDPNGSWGQQAQSYIQEISR